MQPLSEATALSERWSQNKEFNNSNIIYRFNNIK